MYRIDPPLYHIIYVSKTDINLNAASLCFTLKTHQVWLIHGYLGSNHITTRFLHQHINAMLPEVQSSRQHSPTSTSLRNQGTARVSPDIAPGSTPGLYEYDNPFSKAGTLTLNVITVNDPNRPFASGRGFGTALNDRCNGDGGSCCCALPLDTSFWASFLAFFCCLRVSRSALPMMIALCKWKKNTVDPTSVSNKELAFKRKTGTWFCCGSVFPLFAFGTQNVNKEPPSAWTRIRDIWDGYSAEACYHLCR